MGKRITIKDIAEQAGVSPGTVDRILHNRGNVSKRSRAAVDKVLVATGYTSDDYFASSAKPHVLAVFTPTSTIGDYWSAVYDGIRNALQDYLLPGISLEFFHYNQFDVYSCMSAQNSVLHRRPDAVVIGPTFMQEARSFCASLEEAGIPYVFIDSYIENTGPLASFTTDQISGGKVMAHLLAASTESGSKIAVFESLRSGGRMSSNSIARMDGFMDYLHSTGRDVDLVETCYTSTVPEENEQALMRILNRHGGDIKGIAVLNSRGSSIAAVLEKIGRTDIRLMSFDLTMQNVEYLRKGIIRALLCQHPYRQGYLATSTLIRYLMRGKEPDNVYNYLPIDIVLKENIDLYRE